MPIPKQYTLRKLRELEDEFLSEMTREDDVNVWSFLDWLEELEKNVK